MKKIKKILLLLLVCTTLVSLTGCGSKTVEGTLEEIMTKVYEDIPDEERPMMLTNMEVNDEKIEYEEVLASESAVGSIAHSVVLVRAKENADIEATKTKILDNVDPRKWICVGVEKEDVIDSSK